MPFRNALLRLLLRTLALLCLGGGLPVGVAGAGVTVVEGVVEEGEAQEPLLYTKAALPWAQEAPAQTPPEGRAPSSATSPAPADSTVQRAPVLPPDPVDPSISPPADETETHGDHGPTPPGWMALPFVLLLLMIATGPLFYPHHWHHHYPKYSIAFGLFVAAYYLFVLEAPLPILHAVQEYLSFIALVASLFIAASGIYVHINARGTPLNNVLLLFLSALIANLIATTGAAMLFIRSYMRLNKGRLRAYHIIFFIFITGNIGGALTPIGDPPLFLGFLRGVPFFWTITHLWYIWLPAILLLLAVFWAIDRRNTAEGAAPDPSQPLVTLQGQKSLVWVALIIGCVFLDPNVFAWVPNLPKLYHSPLGVREILMFTLAALAYRTADRAALKANEFTFAPIQEVGLLFLGIFATMQPALQLISIFAADNKDLLTTGMFYWATGVLSAVLDNAPTYLNFLAAAMGKFGLDVNAPEQVRNFAIEGAINPETWHYLQAISIGAVFFGAMTYIGNAPNFMIKAIAEANGVDTPSFVVYLYRYALPILLPIFFVIWVVFFSGWVLRLT
jgi:Na+/H+ antiporter NhaD/arsenite permease-like protein